MFDLAGIVQYFSFNSFCCCYSPNVEHTLHQVPHREIVDNSIPFPYQMVEWFKKKYVPLFSSTLLSMYIVIDLLPFRVCFRFCRRSDFSTSDLMLCLFCFDYNYYSWLRSNQFKNYVLVLVIKYIYTHILAYVLYHFNAFNHFILDIKVNIFSICVVAATAVGLRIEISAWAIHSC